jgi:hypothetical protein
LVHQATQALYAIEKPEFWDPSLASPCVVTVPPGCPEFDLVQSRFHVHGFRKPILKVERVQVRRMF